MDICFDESIHQYYEQIENGRRTIPSVTQILSSGWKPDPYFGEKGRKIHKAIWLYIRGRLDEKNLSPIIKTYLEAYKSFIITNKVEIVCSESIIYNTDPEYAGTLDAVLEIGNDIYVADWKTGVYQTMHKYQLALYALAEYGKDYESINLGLLYLHDDETFEWKVLKKKDQMKVLDKALLKVDDYYKKKSVIFQPKAEIANDFFL